jgi:NADH dehydrogenase
MASSDPPLVLVLGGTGQLGSRIVRALLAHGARVRVAARRPPAAETLAEGAEAAEADVRDPRTLGPAAEGVSAVVNAVSLYQQTWSTTFRDIHVEGAAKAADAARQAGAALVHVSGIGADPRSPERYLRARGQGEQAARQAHPQVRIVRPSALIGPQDALISGIRALLRIAPVYPLFGRGETRLQPVAVQDAGEGAARLALAREAAPVHDFAGPEPMTYRELVETVALADGRSPSFLPVPFALWRAIAAVAERLPSAPLTTDQVALMAADNLPDPEHPGLPALGVKPRPLREVLG